MNHIMFLAEDYFYRAKQIFMKKETTKISQRKGKIPLQFTAFVWFLFYFHPYFISVVFIPVVLYTNFFSFLFSI